MLDGDGIISLELRSIIEHTNDLLFVKNRDLVYIASSKNYALNCVRCNGVEDVIGKTDYELFDNPEIAEKYRADDKALLESGKDMEEFEEEYPHRDGTRHMCLTTKYVIRDTEGNPVAILGQYHDISKATEEEIKRSNEINNHVIDALSRSFFAANYVDLQTHTFVTVRSMDYARTMVKDCETIEQGFEAFIQTLVKSEFQERMREFCDSETLADRLRGKTHIDCEYLSKVVSGWCQASFYPTEWDEQGEVTHLLFAVSGVDEDKAKEIEESIINKKDVEFLRRESIQEYRDRLHALQKSNEDALCMCDVNLSVNKFYGVQAEGIIKRCSEEAETLDEFMQCSSKAVIDPEEQKKYRELFNCEELIKRFEQGETHIRFEHYYRISNNNTSMVATIFDLIREPVTGHVVGIAYAKDMNRMKVANIMLNAALSRDYPMAALVYADTGEFYLYEVGSGEYCTHRQDYWKVVSERLEAAVDGEQLEEIRSNLNAEKVSAQLETHDEYVYAFNGTYHGIEGRYECKFRYVDKNLHLMLAVLRNITDEELTQQYKYESEHDLLTGLYNRNTVFRQCRELMDAHPEEKFVMLHLDVRHFHLYNSFFGDAGGDRLLCGIADALKLIGEDYDYFTCGRTEADVFCVFFPVREGLFEKHIKHSFEALDEFSPNFPLRLAIGTYLVVDPSMSVEAMFSRATIAAKSNKKNLFGLVSRYDDNMDREMMETQLITGEMTAAIENEEFEVYLQPKYALRSNAIVGSEALVRWKHPKRGIITPGMFVPVFEQNGFIAELDKYMWEHVCRILRGWLDEGKPIHPISVNISRVSMYSHQTVPFLKELVTRYRLDPKYMELELTETAYMDDPEDLKRMLKELQEFGFRILMDDFGNGYSSLNTLRDLPVDVLKLDMKFLSRTQDDERSMAVLSSVIRMSKLLKLPIVAEGVEEQGQADYLRSIGCEYVQGYLYAKPMPRKDYEKLLVNEADAEESAALEDEASSSFSESELSVEEPYIPIGVLEYDSERFAYLRTNRMFLQEFGLIDNLKPASEVFREHMDDRDYSTLLEAFAVCSEKKKDTFCSVKWIADENNIRTYHGYVRYHGDIGSYSDLSVTFMNVTDTERIGPAELLPNKDELSVVSSQIKHSLETEAGIWNNLRKLVEARDINESTNSIIQEVLHYYDADRAYIFEFDWDRKVSSNTFEVCAPQVEPVIDSLQDIPLEAMDLWVKMFRDNSMVHIRNLDELAGDESRREEYEYLEPQGIKSLMAAPVFYDDKLVGFLGVDNPKCNLSDKTFITSLAFFCVNVSLKERELAELEKKNSLDALTGAYNRKGYEEIIEQLESDRRPMAYIQLDIDNFKKLNDTYGHDFGDEVLKQLVKQLKNAFRAGDYVFRFGGDEFAVLLTNCNINNWDSIGDKQGVIHIRLNQILRKGVYVTLSMGVSCSEEGFKAEMVPIADAALYQAKRNGRAGCCVFDSDHRSIYEWRDDIGNAYEENTLEKSQTGACRIELPGGELAHARLICNETARVLMGFDESMLPEECFRTWLERIDPYSMETISKTRKAMQEKGQAECTYIYHHPVHGQIMVRSGGRCLNNEDGIVFYGYHQSLQDTRIILQPDDGQKLIAAMLDLYFAAYYISLKDDRFWIFKSTEESRHMDEQDIPASAGVRNFVETLVKPEYREKVGRFLNLETLPDRLKDRAYIETEYESVIEDKGWCRIRLFAVKRDEEGAVTYAQLLIASIDKEMRQKKEKEEAVQRALRLQLHAGEMLAETKIQSIGLIDRQTGIVNLHQGGMVSQDALTVSFDQMREWGMAYAYPMDLPLFEKRFNLRTIEAELQRNGECTMAFRNLGENNEIMTMVHHYKVYEEDASQILFVVEDVTASAPKGIGRIEEFNILENLAEAVAVFDFETYEVVYVNKAVRDELGMEMSEFRNRKCYELFCGNSEPCEFCDKIILEQGKHGFMHRRVGATGENNILHGCTVEVQGRKYRLEQAVSLKQLREIEAGEKQES